MKLLGTSATVATIRYDLVYLHASLLSDDDPAVQALAVPIDQRVTALRDERDVYERAEDAVVVLAARRSKRDTALDTCVVTFGGVARAMNKGLYRTFFPTLSPSQTARQKLSREVSEVKRILGELARLPATHALRVSYEAQMRALVEALEAAMRQSEEVDVALALARSRLDQFKLRVDELRVETHGRLLVILKDKDAADVYFRPTTRSPEDAEAEEVAAPATPDSPAAPVARPAAPVAPVATPVTPAAPAAPVARPATPSVPPS